MRAWIAASAAVLTAIGISSPRVAGRSGELLLITIGLIVATVAVQPVFAAIDQRRAEPFVPTPPRTPRATMPNQMAEIVDAFTKHRGSDDLAELVPPLQIHRISTAATGRIVDHHHLHLADIDDHPAIRALVSPTMWALLRPAESAARSAPSVPVLPFADLDRLLDELERL
jgi:hypothetical protein